ncbi:MAG TPA: FAD-dependent oxidoreductase [Candidatus Krumholzibacteria bacterium]|nr:FAD-dependent oxidoreductase [Candidatus Krumholzibacteria bacterium]
MTNRAQFIVLGAGVAGLAAAFELGEAALTLEQNDRPGGLVRTDCIAGYWFDHVLHLLHFQDATTERRIRGLLGSDLVALNTEAFVETSQGVARFPIQLHLAGLHPHAATACLSGLVKAARDEDPSPPANYAEMLERSFGRELCELFFFPYNRKQWKRPLETLAPSGFQWNIARPDIDSATRGALDGDRIALAYNANAWYPRPGGDDIRGMELLSHALAQRATDLRLEHHVRAIDPDAQRVIVTHHGRDLELHYEDACIATLPLPVLMRITAGVPAALRKACSRLLCNRVLNAMIRVRGPRPRGRGFWRYYPDESLCFTRLIHLYEFDPGTAPHDGWGLMAEIVEPSEWPSPNLNSIRAVLRCDLERVVAIPAGCEILGIDIRVVDPAYVVFTPECQAVVERAAAHLHSRGVFPLGRYGRWEYSSMAQVMRDGFALASSLRAQETRVGRTRA